MAESIWRVLNCDGSSLAETTMELPTVDVRALLDLIGILGSVVAVGLVPFLLLAVMLFNLPTWATRNDQHG
jgi:hypothetical protein